MRILFAGTPEIAVPSLKMLSSQFEVIVLTNGDKLSGRGRKIVFSPVKEAALELGLRILQPKELDGELIREVLELKADLLVVVAYGRIFKEEFLHAFPLGGINLHPSLLPRYRGPSPLSEAIRKGDKEIGITVQKFAWKVDSGDILLQRLFSLDGRETRGSLTEKVAHLGAPLVVDAVNMIGENTNAGEAQDESKASFCKLINKDQGLISWEKKSEEIEREIRAFSPWPGSYTYYSHRKLNILEVLPYKGVFENVEVGTVVRLDKEKGIIVKTGDSALAIKRLQLQAKKKMDYRAFINGNREFIGSILDNAPGGAQ